MDKEQLKEEAEIDSADTTPQEQDGQATIKRSFITHPKEEAQSSKKFFVSKDREINYNFQTSDGKKPGGKGLLLIIGLLILVGLGGGAFYFRHQVKTLIGMQPAPTATPEPTIQPTPTPNPLVRSDWSLEVLNGSGESGLAKKVAAQIQDLGYPVVKTGNADKDNYDKTQILVKKDLLDKVDLVIADLKDTVKVASVGGELKEGTASARIILGRDSI